MTLLRYEPWTVVNRLHRELDQVLSGNTGADGNTDSPAPWTPLVDIYEEPDRFVAFLDVAGVEPKDIEITAEKGVLAIRGERRAQRPESKSAWQHLERRSGTFLRRFTLPEGANLEAISARHAHGVLEVTIPKHAKLQARRIEVAAA